MSKGIKIALLALACFATSISEYAIVGIIDIVAASLGVSITAAGMLLTGFALSGAIGVPLLTMALSRFDRRDVMTISLALVVLGCLLVSLASSYALIMASRVFMAIGAGMFAVTCFAAAPSLAEEGKQTSAIATVTLGFNAALVLGLPLGRFLTEVLPWTAVFWFVGVASLVMIPVVRSIIPARSADESAPAKAMPLRQQLSYLKRPNVLFAFGITLFWTSGYALMYSYITPYLQETTELASAQLSAVLLVFGLATLVGNKLGGYLSDHYGIRRTIVPGIVLQVVMMVAMYFLNGPLWLVVASVVIWGVFAWIPSPVINMAVIQAAPDASDVMLSLNNSVTQLAYSIGSGVGGAIVALGSTHNLCLAAIVFLALGAGSTIMATRDSKSSARTETETVAVAQNA
ncbi:MAG: MFS transporter [Coriobacteriales bacterium]|jgi:DHA1 family putative efflux transporter-like MFS transporter